MVWCWERAGKRGLALVYGRRAVGRVKKGGREKEEGKVSKKWDRMARLSSCISVCNELACPNGEQGVRWRRPGCVGAPCRGHLATAREYKHICFRGRLVSW